MKAQDIGLIVITSKAQGWQKGLTNETLVGAIRDDKIKFTYTDEMFEEEEVIGLIEKNLIELKDCFSIMDNVLFKKLRTGLSQLHSPTSNR